MKRLVWIALVLAGCSSVPPHAVVTVEDPNEIGAGTTTLVYGTELDSDKEIDIAGLELPTQFVLWSQDAQTVELWIDARSSTGELLGRGRVSVDLPEGGAGAARVDLGYVCHEALTGDQHCVLANDTDGITHSGVCPAEGECVASTCGDGLTDAAAGEGCDDGNIVSEGEGSCPEDCGGLQECGDGSIQGTEDCDDQNSDNCDGCLEDCTSRSNLCGDAIACTGVEDCDEGDADTATCNYAGGSGDFACTDADCGDGYTNTEAGEECDDGRADSGLCDYAGDTLPNRCTLRECGDGHLSTALIAEFQPYERCDDGADNGTISTTIEYCRPDCQWTQLCGNGDREGSEACDDGNDLDSDGCSAGCMPEPGFTCAGTTPSVCRSVLYVDAAVVGGAGDGTTWADAFPHLRDALAAAAISPVAVELWIAAGTYYPNASVTPLPTPANIYSFDLTNDVALLGGFAPGMSDRAERDPAVHATVLSGAITSPEVTNSYHVVRASETNDHHLLDGLTITGGDANGVMPDDSGGGLWIQQSAVSIYNCRFVVNSADTDGGAIATEMAWEVDIVGSVFVDNVARNGVGGAVDLEGGRIVVGSRFAGNYAGGGGGAMELYGEPLLVSNVFTGNTTDGCGGAIRAGQAGEAPVINCSFFANAAAAPLEIWDEFTGGALCWSNQAGRVAVGNSLFWNNVPHDVSPPEVEEPFGGGPNTNCFNCDCRPSFVAARGADGIPGTEDDDLSLPAGSTCIDAGNNESMPNDEFDVDGDGDRLEPIGIDILGLPRFTDDPTVDDAGSGDAPIVDIGAYEVQP